MSGRARILVGVLIVLLVGAAGCKRPSQTKGPQPGQPAVASYSEEKVLQTAVCANQPAVALPLGIKFGRELLLVGYSVKPPTVVKGEPATLEITWKCLSKPSRDWRFWTKMDYEGTPSRRLGCDHNPTLPTSRWQPGKYYRDQIVFAIPKDFKGGVYRLSIGVFTSRPYSTLPQTLTGPSEQFGAVNVAPSRGEKGPGLAGETREPRVSERLGVTFGKELILVGYSVSPSPLQKGRKAELQIVWKCLGKVSHNWRIWTHLDYTAQPSRRLNLDHDPTLPSTLWRAGEYYRDRVEFTVPGDFKPGKYRLGIGPFKSRPVSVYLPEKVVKSGQRYGTVEVGFSAGR